MKDFVSMVAPHSRRPVEPDRIFGVSKAAQEAAQKVGFENVINSTIGALMDDQGQLEFIPTVMKHIREMDDAKIAAYAPIAGLPDYLTYVQDACFMDHRPEKAYTAAVATPGGTGAINHAVWNYAEMGDEILTSDWFWAPYRIIASEHGRKIATFNFFNENGQFDLTDFKKRVEATLSKQERLLIILNTPAHNPTGYTVKDSEWAEIMNYLRHLADSQPKPVTLFVDIAYIDFAGDLNEARAFMEEFNDLRDNLLVLIGFSMSKGFTLYGMRSGAIICVANNEATRDEFNNVCSFSNRGTWSNGTRAAMQTLADVFSQPALKAQVFKERDELFTKLRGRIDAFMKGAKENGIETAPFDSGFFISIPHEDPIALAEKLYEDNLYLVALEKGIRFAPCAVSEEKCALAPSLIRKAMDALK